VRETGASVLSSFGGFDDLAVPVWKRGALAGIIHSGPFLTKELSVEDIRAQWKRLTGRLPRPFDPDFAAYGRTALGTQILEGEQAASYQEFLELMALAFAGEADLIPIRSRVAELRKHRFAKLASARLSKGAGFLHPLGQHSADGMLNHWDQEELGLVRVPNTALAVVPFDSDPGGEEVVPNLVRGAWFQRRCVSFSHSMPHTVCAPLEDHGVYFLCDLSQEEQTPARVRAFIEEHVERIGAFVQEELGIRAFIGVGPLGRSYSELWGTAKQAVLAMQLAVHSKAPVVYSDDALDRAKRPVLPNGARRRPAFFASELLSQFSNAAFQQMEVTQGDYVRQVLEDSAGRAAVVRVHFEQFLFALLHSVQQRAELDGRTLSELEEGLATSLKEAVSTYSLLTVFRQWFSNLIHISRNPSKGQKELRLERAAAYIQENCHRSLSLQEVARQVGFSTNYFSRVFKSAFGTGFAHYLLQQRLERAKTLLLSSGLTIHQVARESGFASVTHFCGVFKSGTRMTPQQFRESRAGGKERRARSEKQRRAKP
jgi:AraC-like DNA-binding protein